MKRTIQAVALAVLVALFAGFTPSGCATAGPVVVKCGAQEIPIALADYNQIKTDLATKDWFDLAKIAGRLGYETMSCVFENMGVQSPETKPAIEEFKQLHAVEFRSAG